MGSFRADCASCCLNRHGEITEKWLGAQDGELKGRAQHSRCDWEPLLLFYDSRRSLGQLLLHTPVARENGET